MEPKNQTDTEMLLEDIFVKRPEMLLRGLTLVGRQTTTWASTAGQAVS